MIRKLRSIVWWVGLNIKHGLYNQYPLCCILWFSFLVPLGFSHKLEMEPEEWFELNSRGIHWWPCPWHRRHSSPERIRAYMDEDHRFQ